jgi:rhodanese-related sulfurtransferase
MTASWLAQMNWEVYVLEADASSMGATGVWRPQVPSAPEVKFVTPKALQTSLEMDNVVLIDLAPSPAYRRGHIPGAWFAVRARLSDALLRLPSRKDFVLTSPDGLLAQFACHELCALSGRDVAVLAGGTAAWTASDYPLEPGLSRAASAIDDVYRRPYEGTDNDAAAMQAYLEWEYGLVAQLARDGTHGFFVI